MTEREELLIEANKRGLLSGQMKQTFDVAVERGLINIGGVKNTIPSEADIGGMYSSHSQPQSGELMSSRDQMPTRNSMQMLDPSGVPTQEASKTDFILPPKPIKYSPPESKEPWLGSRVADDIGNRLKETKAFIDRPSIEVAGVEPVSKWKTDPEAVALGVAGQSALALANAGFEATKSGYKTFTPEAVQKEVGERLKNLGQSIPGKAVINGFKKGGKAWKNIKKKHPDEAFLVESALGLAEFGLLAKGASKTLKEINKAAKARKGLGKIDDAILNSIKSRDELKGLSSATFKGVDNLGVTVNDGAFSKMVNKINDGMYGLGLDLGTDKLPTTHPKAMYLRRRLEDAVGETLTTRDYNILRTIAKNLADAPGEQGAMGKMAVQKIDNLLTETKNLNIPKNVDHGEVGAYLKKARDLWGRSERSKLIEDAFYNAGLEKNFPVALASEFKKLVKNKDIKKYFNDTEIASMERVAKGDLKQNIYNLLAKAEIGGTQWFLGTAGAGAGYYFLGPAGAVAVPIIGHVSKKLGNRLIKNRGNFADQVIRAGKNADKITEAYLKNTPKKMQSYDELSELLLNDGIDFAELPKTDFAQRAMIAANAKRQYASDMRDAMEEGLTFDEAKKAVGSDYNTAGSGYNPKGSVTRPDIDSDVTVRKTMESYNEPIPDPLDARNRAMLEDRAIKMKKDAESAVGEAGDAILPTDVKPYEAPRTGTPESPDITVRERQMLVDEPIERTSDVQLRERTQKTAEDIEQQYYRDMKDLKIAEAKATERAKDALIKDATPYEAPQTRIPEPIKVTKRPSEKEWKGLSKTQQNRIDNAIARETGDANSNKYLSNIDDSGDLLSGTFKTKPIKVLTGRIQNLYEKIELQKVAGKGVAKLEKDLAHNKSALEKALKKQAELESRLDKTKQTHYGRRVEDRKDINPKKKEPKTAWNPKKDKVVLSAMKTKDGKIFQGESHGHAYSIMAREGAPLDDFIEGFVTESGRFITSKEAKRGIGLSEFDAIQDLQD